MTEELNGRVVIAPSLLAADFGRLREEVASVTAAGADWLHFDIMDGHFVPNISFGPQVLAALRPHSALPFDVHLMITPVDPYVQAFAEAGADHISVHPEAGPHPHRTLQLIRSLGKKAGLVLNPGTPVESIAWLLELADIVLVMSVNPGFGGQKFLPSQLPKIAALRRLIDAQLGPMARPIALAVDGGITPETAAEVRAAGADTLIAGTSVFAAPDRAAAIMALRHGATEVAPGRLDKGKPAPRWGRVTAGSRLLRGARQVVARLPLPRFVRVPDAPTQPVRDPWPGDINLGARLLKGELEYGGGILALRPGGWNGLTGSGPLLTFAHGFTWLRHLRALGTDPARLLARGLVSDWMASSPSDPIARRPDVAGARITAWLGHYDFFAATADDPFRQRLMARLVSDARSLSAALPAEELDARALTALKGLIAAAVALPEHNGFLIRAMRFLPREVARQVLPDGFHVERSPMAQLTALQDMTEIRTLLQAGQIQPPPVLANTIERMAPALRAMRHGDGGLALFNGSREETSHLVDLVLTQAGRGSRAPAASTEGGFQRLQAGRTVLIVDAGAPPPPDIDRTAHAGTLSMELSVGRDRMIVNVGAFPAGGSQWHDAARATAAHSTLIIGDLNSSELLEHGLGRRPGPVMVQRQEANGAHWLEAAHDGWSKPFGAIHRRRLYLSESGEDIRGEDVIEADSPQAFTLRFHLHPSVQASLQQDSAAVLMRLRSGGGWILRADGAQLSLDESIYLGSGELRKTEQIVLTGREGGPQHVKWAIHKVG